MYPENNINNNINNNVQNYNQQPVNNEQYQMNNNQTPNNEKKKSKLPIIIIVIMLAIAVVLGAIFLLGNKEPTNENTIPPVTDNKEPDNDVKYDVITEEIVRNHKVTPASDFTYEEIGNEIRINSYIGNDEIVVIPEEIEGKKVVELGGYIFANESKVRGVYIPTTIKKLSATFTNNNNLEVAILEGVEHITDSAFLNCDKMHTAILGENLVELGEASFSRCESLTELYISSKLEKIEDAYARLVFYKCNNLTIKGETGSYIESYCKERNIPFEVK